MQEPRRTHLVSLGLECLGALGVLGALATVSIPAAVALAGIVLLLLAWVIEGGERP